MGPAYENALQVTAIRASRKTGQKTDYPGKGRPGGSVMPRFTAKDLQIEVIDSFNWHFYVCQ
jgi:hypothetical protein